MPHPNDPAIMQMQLPNGQHLIPHFPMPAMNPQMGNYGIPFGSLGNIAGIGGAAGLAPGSFMLNSKPKQQSELSDAIPEPSMNTSAPSNVSGGNNIALSTAAEHKDQGVMVIL